jgi:hypothetical protein
MCCQIQSGHVECMSKIAEIKHPTLISINIHLKKLHTNCTEFLETTELTDFICINKHLALELLDLMESFYTKILYKKAFRELTGKGPFRCTFQNGASNLGYHQQNADLQR